MSILVKYTVIKYFGGFLLVNKTFPGFLTLGVHNRFLQAKALIKRSNSVLPDREIREMFY